MTVSRYYQYVLRGQRTHLPTFEEARRDYDDLRSRELHSSEFRDHLVRAQRPF